MRLSVVIANYNYARFVGAAIDSALQVEVDDVEVIVVDDGSTDDSRAVIESYGDRITHLYLRNSGQRQAINAAYPRVSGDVVIFLDADDLLPPELGTALTGVWGPMVSKVQFQMQRIDENGAPIGNPFPTFEPPPTASDVRNWLIQTTAYPTPPGSGNAYARWFTDRLFPIDPSVGEFVDSALLAAAPVLGDVVSVPGVLVGYRRHGANDSDLVRDPDRFSREVERARARWGYLHRLRELDGHRDAARPVSERPLHRSRELLQLRVAATRLSDRGSTLPGDGRLRQAIDALVSLTAPGPEGFLKRMAIAAWSLSTALAPLRLARRLITARYRHAG